MKIIFILFFCSILLCQFKPIDKLMFVDSDSNINQEQSISIKYPISSLIVPGLGQYQIYKETDLPKHKLRAVVFFSIDLLSAGMHFNFRSKHNNQKISYKNFADTHWDFSHWISSYDHFDGTEYDHIWTDPNGAYTQIGESSHFVQFYFDGELKRTTDSDFQSLYHTMINEIDSGLDIYEEHSISIISDQHFYENIGKYNEFFSGWADADLENIIVQTTGQNYTIALSPQKNIYIDSYDKAESYSDIAENILTSIYFNHFISMLDAFILARKFGGKFMLDSVTIYDKKRYSGPVGVKINLSVKL